MEPSVVGQLLRGNIAGAYRGAVSGAPFTESNAQVAAREAQARAHRATIAAVDQLLPGIAEGLVPRLTCYPACGDRAAERATKLRCFPNSGTTWVP